MTEQAQENFGLAAEQERAGYEPMVPAFPVDTPDDKSIEGGRDELSKAASEITERREQAQRERESSSFDIERRYNESSGPRAGERMPENQTVSKEQAAADLAMARHGEAETQATLEDLELQRVIDALRSGDQPQQPEPTQAQQPEQPQPEAYKPAELGDPEIQRLLETSPKLLEAIQAYDWQTSQQVEAAQNQAAQAVAAHKQEYVNALANNALAAASALFHDVPEIAATGDPVAALRMIASQNPERARAISQRITQVQSLMQQHAQQEQQNRQAYAAAAQQQFAAAARQHDEAFDKWAATQDSPERVRQIKEVALGLLREDMTDDQIQHAYNTDATLRSLTAQKNLYRAARAELLSRSVKEKVSRPVPTVQPPSSPAARASEQDYSMRQLEKRLSETGSAKDAAALLLARRNARR
jgi:hypothetical protein